MKSLFDSLQLLTAPGDLDPKVQEALESFLVAELTEASVWKGRESDGIQWARCKAVEATRVRVCGECWQVSDQTLHGFWLDLEGRAGSKISWSLHYDIDRTRLSPRLARDAIHLLEDPSDVVWRVTLTGP